MSLAKFSHPSLNGTTVTINRELGLITVRPKYARSTYTLPLSTVADIIVSKVVKSNLDDAGISVPQARKGRQR